GGMALHRSLRPATERPNNSGAGSQGGGPVGSLHRFKEIRTSPPPAGSGPWLKASPLIRAPCPSVNSPLSCSLAAATGGAEEAGWRLTIHPRPPWLSLFSLPVG